MKGIEPSSQPWQGRIITSILHLHLEAKTRIELATCWLQVSCTASCATWPLDRDTGFEPAPSAWKAEMLAADTNPGFSEISLSTLYKYYITIFKKNQIFTSKVFVGLSCFEVAARNQHSTFLRPRSVGFSRFRRFPRLVLTLVPNAIWDADLQTLPLYADYVLNIGKHPGDFVLPRCASPRGYLGI